MPSGLPEDFDRAFLSEGMAGLYATSAQREEMEFLGGLYEAWHPARIPPSASPRIPFVLHQVWMGGELPPMYRRWRERWMELHPEWEHRLWTDAEIADLDFETRDLFESTDHVAMKSDLIRVEVIRKFGGLYVDTDYECLRPLDPFHYRYDFYGSLRAFPALFLIAPGTASQPSAICNSIIGARAGHPVLDRYLKKVRRLWSRVEEVKVPLGERFLGRIIRRDFRSFRHAAKITYLPFHTSVLRYLRDHGHEEPALVAPPSYFNPVDGQWYPMRYVAPVYWLGLIRHALRRRGRWPRHYRVPQAHSFTVHHSESVWTSEELREELMPAVDAGA